MRGYRFTTVTPATHLRVNARPQNSAAGTVEDVFGWSRPFAEAVLPNGLLKVALQAHALVPDAIGWRSLVRASTLDNLLLLHSAHPTVAPDSVFLGPDTYRFAQTVTSHLAGRTTPVRRAVDIGCGTGAAGIVIALAYPGSTVLLTDINPAAVMAARINALANKATNVICKSADMFNGVDGSFDLIVANPPYLVDPAERAYRHGGGPFGALLSIEIVRRGIPRLVPGGSLVLYTGSAIIEGRDLLREALQPILSSFAANWSYREVDPDVFGEELESGPTREADRIAAVVLNVERTQ